MRTDLNYGDDLPPVIVPVAVLDTAHNPVAA